jgi:hypothetical protein
VAASACLGWLTRSTKSAASLSNPMPATGALEVSGTPGGVRLSVDGVLAALVPTVVSLDPGPYTVTVQAPEAIAETRRVEVGSPGVQLDLALWRAHPTVHYLRPTFHGAALVDERFVANGHLGLWCSCKAASGRPGPSTLTPISREHLGKDRYPAPTSHSTRRPASRSNASYGDGPHLHNFSDGSKDRVVGVPSELCFATALIG